MRIRKPIVLLFTAILLWQCCWFAGAKEVKTTAIKNSVLEYIASHTPSPVFSPVGGEWAVLCLARGSYITVDDPYFTAYYQRIKKTVKETILPNGAMHRTKSTDNSRLILALTAIGKNPHKVAGNDLLAPYTDFDWISRQGINGTTFALLALDSKPYESKFSTVRTQCVENLLELQLASGGWTLSGTKGNPDVTAMVLQALANYKDAKSVSAAAQRGFQALSAMQNKDGSFSDSCESIAQVVTACAAWGIDPDTDARFVKSSGSAWGALCSFYLPKVHAFMHVKKNGTVDTMATEQAGYAIVAYDRFLHNQTALYEMSDVVSQQQATTTKPTTAAPTTESGWTNPTSAADFTDTFTQTTAPDESTDWTTVTSDFTEQPTQETSVSDVWRTAPQTTDWTTPAHDGGFTTTKESSTAQTDDAAWTADGTKPQDKSTTYIAGESQPAAKITEEKTQKTSTAATAQTPNTGETGRIPAAAAGLLFAVAGLACAHMLRKKEKTT